METAVIIFPGSNCDRDSAVAVALVTGKKPYMIWHTDTELPKVDLIILPGGFSYGDYLRTGAMAAHSPIMSQVIALANKGVHVLGICNGFQILCETGLLPGALLRNANLKFICRTVSLKVENNNTSFTKLYKQNQTINVPIAHGEGNYFADEDTLNKIEDKGLVVFRYLENPNGSAHDIAGIINEKGNVLGMMPHPERVVEPLHGGTDGVLLFESLMRSL